MSNLDTPSLRPSWLEGVFIGLREEGDRPAVQGETGTATYSELASLAGRLSRGLEDIPAVGRAPRVAIHTAKSPGAYAAILACVAAGATFCPINVEAPAGRNSRILDDFQPDCAFLGADAARRDHPALSGLAELAPKRSDRAVELRPRPASSIAYVIYTSGTSGFPKGVQISYRNLDWFLSAVMARLEVAPGSRWSNHPNLAFDLSILDIFGAIGSRSTLIPLSSPFIRAFPARAIADEAITVWHSVPSIVENLRQVRAGECKMLASLERVILCGEPCRRGWVDYLTTHCAHDVRVFNAYGPTETTVFCTTEEIARGYPFDDREPTIALGNALAGASVDLVPTATEEREVVVSSPGVGPGYLRSRAGERDGYQTVASGKRIYYTGDLAEISAGKMYYRGRADAQVKLRGNRFELCELEAFLEASGVPGAHASAVEDAVVVFVDERCRQTDKDLHVLLEDAMPSYAVPRLIFRLAAWPRNVNDKIDRAALASLARRELRRGA